jgi:sugar/nucleoside kinase (ribokinase family)
MQRLDQNTTILGSIGDLLLDVVIVPSGPLRPGDDVPAVVRVGGGGQAANFCAWVAALGARARLITRIGGDDVGQRLVAELRESGADVRATLGPGPTGAIAVLVGAGGERSFATQRGAILGLRPEDLDPTSVADLNLLHVPAYSLFYQPLASATLAAVELVRSRGGLLAVDLSSAAGLTEYGVGRMTRLLTRLGPEVLFASRGEADVMGAGVDRLARVVVRKLGQGGCAVDGRVIPAPKVDVVDTTGAGDAFAAGFCLFYLRDADPVNAARNAVDVAARAVTRLGGRP